MCIELNWIKKWLYSVSNYETDISADFEPACCRTHRTLTAVPTLRGLTLILYEWNWK